MGTGCAVRLCPRPAASQLLSRLLLALVVKVAEDEAVVSLGHSLRHSHASRKGFDDPHLLRSKILLKLEGILLL